MITEQQIHEAASVDYHEKEDATRFEAFIAGANWAREQQAQDIHNALKGLGLEKHSTALNVLRIAGIKPPVP